MKNLHMKIIVNTYLINIIIIIVVTVTSFTLLTLQQAIFGDHQSILSMRLMQMYTFDFD